MKKLVRGFTLVELMIVIAVMAILLVLAAPSMYDFILLQRLKSINAQVVTDIQFARSEAAARNLNVRFRLTTNADVTCYILYTGADRACDCTVSPVCAAPSEQEIRTVQVPRSLQVTVTRLTDMSEFFFDPVTGAMSPTATDAIRDPGDPFFIDSAIDTARKLRTVVKASGRPSVCAPPGSTMPVPACP